MPNNKKSYTIKLPVELANKVKSIAEKEKRPFSSQIELMLENELQITDIDKSDLFIASESALKKDWLSEEEDKAWQDL